MPNLIEHLDPSAAGGNVANADGHLELASLFAGDNVQLTLLGYGRLAVCITSSIQEVVKQRLESECEVTYVLKNFYWRGFTSHTRSSRPKLLQHALKMRVEVGGRDQDTLSATGVADGGRAVAVSTTLTATRH